MDFLIHLVDKCFPQVDCNALKEFMQKQANRLQQGHVRYGKPNRRKKYMTRMGKELKAYKKTGNAEHLLNIANYCWLENQKPEHENFHFDATVDSVTRGKAAATSRREVPFWTSD